MKNIYRIVWFLTVFTFFWNVPGYAAEKDYRDYHKGIINAEYALFINNDSIKGLQIFKQTFDNYDFVFVDDCLEAFQLALFYKQDSYAMVFIKKALENGFELKLLDLLTLGCPCNYYTGLQQKVTIYKKFIEKNRQYLEGYSNACYPKYINRIDKDLWAALLKRHVREQLYKNYHKELGWTEKDQLVQYHTVSDDNLRFMDSLAKKKIFLGERNLGIYTNKQAANLKLPYISAENCLAQILGYYGIPKNTDVPIVSESNNYLIQGPVYTMQYHNRKSYDSISNYEEEAIRKGYLHPREYASLKFNYSKNKDDLFLQPSNNPVHDTAGLDERRRNLLLPSYEIDYRKHLFAHKNNLQLFFGMFNGTR